MPRPEIKGLKYFPFDVGFFRDNKVRLLRTEHGARGIEVYQRLLCKIYEDNGYYLPWRDSEDYALLAEETGYSEGKIRLIVSSCLGRSLFDDTLFEGGNVLTSRSIQRRYFSAIRETKMRAAANDGRHTFIEKDLCLLTVSDFSELNKTHVWLKVTYDTSKSEINTDKSPINTDKSPINSLNEMKGNEMKGNDDGDTAQYQSEREGTGKISSAATEQKLIKYYLDNIQATPSKTTIDTLCSWLDTFPVAVIIKAIDEAIIANKRSLSYVSGILRSWEEKKLFSVSLVEGHLEAWKNRTKKPVPTQLKPKNRFNNYTGREWDFEDIERREREKIKKDLGVSDNE